MPRDTERKKALKFWKQVAMFHMFCMKQRFVQTNILQPDNFQSGFLSDDFGFILYFLLYFQRYSTSRISYRKYNLFDQFEMDLRESGDGDMPTFLNESEFRQKYRMSRESLFKLHNLIKDHDAFNSRSKTRHQKNPLHQLMCLLVYLSCEGTGASNPMLRCLFRLGRGTFDNYKKRCIRAIIDCMGDKYFNWPSDGERTEIARRFKTDFGWPNLVGVVDGTLLPLAFQPQTEDAPDYHGRKYRYSLTVLVINDDKKRIRYFLAGWPGKTHDNRVLRNSKVGREPEKFFQHNEYIIGDSAFEAQWYCIPAFKKPAGLPIPLEHSRFNNLLSSPRVMSEHTIGMWKGRFPWLRSIRMKIKDDNTSLLQILQVIKATVILHNFLIEENDNFEDSWYDLDGVSDVDDADIEGGDELNRPASHQSNLRREQLMHYLNENNIF
jgi:hypothetical protein